MNTFIEVLNRWSVGLPEFAWQMFWQSSLLIAALFAFDFAMRLKIRASVRYALWLVIILKLAIPPTLALPTGLAWWLRTPQTLPIAQTHCVVTYSHHQQ